MGRMNKRHLNERISNEQLMQTLQNSECIVTKADVMRAYDDLAVRLNTHYAGRNPIVLVAMNGGLIPAGQLLPRLSFFHRMEYIHATRYRNNEATNDLKWLAKPPVSLKDEHVLIIDDIYDEGVTLRAIIEELHTESPASIKTCVLINKEHDRKLPNLTVDFIGLNVPDRYVFGCGMDYHGYLRHLAGIFAI